MKKKLIYLAISIGIVLAFVLFAAALSVVDVFLQNALGISTTEIIIIWLVVLVALIFSILLEADKEQKEDEK